MMTLTVVTPEVGEYKEELSIDYDGDVVEIAFNPDFVLDVLRRMESDQVAVVVKDAMSPGILKPCTDAPDDTYINVVMPIRI
jgi:DNA polymerase-3 subunit beta